MIPTVKTSFARFDLVPTYTVGGTRFQNRDKALAKLRDQIADFAICRWLDRYILENDACPPAHETHARFERAKVRAARRITKFPGE